MKTEQPKENTQRLILAVEYDGSNFHGWQRQSHSASIQGTLEEVLSTIAAHPIEVTCAGRTDTGVHATSQVVHFDCPNQRPDKAWLKGANSLLPAPIAIRYVQKAEPDFHARFSATSRSYTYIIDNSPTRPGIMHQGITWYKKHLDIEKINQAGKLLMGENDFSSFRSAQCQSHSVHRCVTELKSQRVEDYVIISITANAFLHHMVRNIVGLMFEIGDGRKNSEWAYEVMAAKDRTLAGITAPADGLYLTGVSYPEKFQLPRFKREPLFLFHSS